MVWFELQSCTAQHGYSDVCGIDDSGGITFRLSRQLRAVVGVAGAAVTVPNALLLTGKGALLGTLQLSSVVMLKRRESQTLGLNSFVRQVWNDRLAEGPKGRHATGPYRWNPFRLRSPEIHRNDTRFALNLGEGMAVTRECRPAGRMGNGESRFSITYRST